MTPAVAGKSFARHLFRLIQAKTLDATSLGFDGKVGLVSGLARQLDADRDLRSSDRRMLAPQTDSLNEMPAVAAAPRCRGHGYQLHGPVAWARDRLCPTMPLRLLPLICKVADGPQWRGAVSRPRPSNRKCGFLPHPTSRRPSSQGPWRRLCALASKAQHAQFPLDIHQENRPRPKHLDFVSL